MNKLSEITLNIPSKTFLIGEYAVLGGAPAAAIVLNTKPCFIVKATPQEISELEHIPEESPVHQALSELDFKITFEDPHAGRGGFGGSGAEWVSYYLLKNIPEKDFTINPFSAFKLMQSRHQCNASGVDILSQLTGKVAIVDKLNEQTSSNEWPFAALGFAIVRTGEKIKTHEHLNHLNLNDFIPLKVISQRCVEAFQAKDEHLFIQCMNAYQETLSSLKLCCERTQTLIQPMQASDFFLAVKGCGALGADTILMLYDKANTDRVKDFILSWDLELVATEADLTELTWTMK